MCMCAAQAFALRDSHFPVAVDLVVAERTDLDRVATPTPTRRPAQPEPCGHVQECCPTFPEEPGPGAEEGGVSDGHTH